MLITVLTKGHYKEKHCSSPLRLPMLKKNPRGSLDVPPFQRVFGPVSFCSAPGLFLFSSSFLARMVMRAMPRRRS